MDLNQLTSLWAAYNEKVKPAYEVNEKNILRTIRNRSASRLASMERLYGISIISNGVWALLFTTAMMSNYFHFVYFLQYIPFLTIDICLYLFLALSIKSLRDIKSVDINHSNFGNALNRIINIIEKYWRYKQWNIVAVMIGAMVVPLSFLPGVIESLGLRSALIVQLTPSLAILLYFLAGTKLGMFKERYGIKFKKDLQELADLKAISSELTKDEI